MNYLQIRWRHLLALSLILLCSVSALFARPLSEREARHLAEQFFHQVAYAHKVSAPAQQPLSLVSAPIRQSAGVELRTLSGDKARYYYIYNRGSNAGFVIIAGDDELTPYIGYATTGRFVVEDMPEQLAAFLKACQERIDELTSSISYHQALQPTRPSASEPTEVKPLLGNIQWNQSAPWNDQTPVVNGEHTPVGCVATAYTQVMRYHQWPTQGEGTFSYNEERSDRQHSVDYGSTTYDWANMPERYDDPSRATEAETKALSTLAYHAGVAVKMMYAPGGSGTYTPLVARALRDHFRYDKRVSFKNRANYTQATWEQLLRKELIAARPIVYSGNGSGGGHAFVCDGYDAEGLFHINWGWGGMSDGYFNLNYLVPSDLGIGGGAGGGFSLGQGAVIGIMPDRTGDSQRTMSSVVTTWRFNMRFDEGTLDATANYEVFLADEATPYNDLITYGVTRLGTTDTTYLDQYALNAHIETLYDGANVESQRLQLSGYIKEGTWDFFLAYRAKKGATGDTLWRPCGQHERAKDQYRRTFTISRESDGSYTVTEDASSNPPKLELVAGSVQSNIVGYEKSQVSLQLRNTGRFEYFNQLYLFARKAGENQFQPLRNILPAIEAGGQERVTFDIDRFPYGSGDVELEVGYFVGGRFTSVWSNTVSIQPAKDVRTAYVLSSDQPVTANLSTGALSQIRIRNVGTMDPHFPDRAFFIYRWELSKGDKKTSTRWQQTDFIHAGDEVSFTPNLKDELRDIDAKVGDMITLSATFVVLYEDNGNNKFDSYITTLEQGSLAVTCEGNKSKNVITMTTAKSVGERISFLYRADGDVSIGGVDGYPQSGEFVEYTLTNQKVTMRGDITELLCPAGRLTDIDVSQCSSLSVLLCFANEIKGESMLQLVNSLPDRTGLENGLFIVYSDGSWGPDGNVCLNSDVAIARAKNWEVALASTENGKLKLYRYDGEDPTKTFAVTLTKDGEGTLTATGADDLNAVPYGTELTIEATPAEGYVLTALTANGEDILATKKLIVRKDTEIKATFAKGDGVITMTTAKSVGESIRLAYIAAGDVSIEGANGSSKSGQYVEYALTNQQITLRGYITELDCYANRLTDLDVSQCSSLRFLFCSANEIKGESMLQLVNSLPDRTGLETGIFVVYSDGSLGPEGNVCLKSDVAIARAKNWEANLARVENGRLYLSSYDGEGPTETFAVTLTKEGEGTLTATGADDLNAVPYGTELTVEATPAEGYELIDLTANGYNILATKKWDVRKDTEIKATFSKVGDSVITMTTAKSVGESIRLAYYADGDVSIEGANGSPESGRVVEYTLTNQKVTMRGDITDLYCEANRLTDIDVSQCSSLRALFCPANEIKGKSMLQLVNSLPDRTGLETGIFIVYSDGSLGPEGNVCLKSDVAIARAKNWEAHLARVENGRLKLYRYDGEDPTKTFAVTFAKEGEGTLTATGADDLNAVPYGTELTVEATPAEGYELTALTANGEDILSSKQFTVKEATEVKATFTKKNIVGDGVITMTTSRAVGEQIMLAVSPVEGQTVIAEGLKESLILDGKGHLYTLTSQTVTLQGNLTLLLCDGAVDLETPPSHENQLTSLDINCETLTLLSCSGNPLTSLDLSHARALTALACYENKLTQLDLSSCTKLTVLGVGNNQLTHLDVSHNGELQFLDCYGNQIKGEAMTALVNGLPDRRGKEPGMFQVIGQDAKTDGNICLKSDVAIAKGKNWSVQAFSGDYEGEDPIVTYIVTLSKEGEGTLTATGADDLNSVAYGTELTIVATPAKGYELTALTANGTDILATKKFVVKDNVTVKATFAKKTFAVKLTKEGEGTLVATGADDLNAVPYGTELTINATPATGYELTALTANGTDILATKKFVVKGATEVKATFAKKSFAVSLTKEGEGTLTATGADNLTAVPYGTELTIAATPAEGYELTALTANGTDILATKKFVVKGATEVKATFEKKTFAVTLTSNEHGTISIVENVDLKAVPYGTPLTVQATGKNDQCELTALTANGEDILATKKFVVKGATEVKATFVDHTGVETTVTQQVKLYPNPATDYVIVEGIAPASEVMLHSMTGELLCAMQADAEGHLQIDLTALSDGVYLLVGTGWQERLVVKK